jgi:threonine dehydratase
MSTARVPLTPDDVARAAERLRAHLAPTPLRPCHALGDRGALLKLECWQPTGSFKVRGATNFLLSLDARERAGGVVAASAGNHALGVAFAASLTGGRVPATLFVPESAPRAKLDKLRRFPVTVVAAGADYDAAAALAHAHAERTGSLELHAFEDARTAAGQGTVGVEILDALPDVDAILVPVGGGGPSGSRRAPPACA